MGQRANYIIKELTGDVTIYYTHWRAINIAQDLALGPKRLEAFIKEFEVTGELIRYPWLESIILLDKQNRRLLFWESEELSLTSVREAYLQFLREIWKGWTVEYVSQEMYTIEQELGIDYISQQEVDFEAETVEAFANEVKEEYLYTLIVVIGGDNTVQAYYSTILIDSLALIGERVIEVLQRKQPEPFKREEEAEGLYGLVINISQKKLIINWNAPHFKERVQERWPEWEVEVHQLGYIHLLRQVKVDTSSLVMEPEAVQQRIKEIIERKDAFSPQETAQAIMEKMEGDVKFHRNFFEDIKPQQQVENQNWFYRLLNKLKK